MEVEAMIAGICSVRNEGDILESCIRHHFGQGIDVVYLSWATSTDDTEKVIEGLLTDYGSRLIAMHDPDPIFIQEVEMTRLARLAVADGAGWVVPWDADEFIAPPDGGKIAAALATVPHEIGKLSLLVRRHIDWNTRVVEPELPRKVVFRGSDPDVSVIVGQHDASIPGVGLEGVLEVREIKYRSFEHFCSKVAAHLETMRPEWGPQYATHVQQFRGASEATMRAAWEAMMAVRTMYDPIPSTLKGMIQ